MATSSSWHTDLRGSLNLEYAGLVTKGRNERWQNQMTDLDVFARKWLLLIPLTCYAKLMNPKPKPHHVGKPDVSGWGI